ncbi:MAG: hypothetical protein V4564_04865 [Pseudomonadota bacterium]|uniref:hypothetical protein n=1 Tax=Sphingomonas sp. ERG5 TaxID=1381597 RepID=UPI000691603A|nr:hypothetical protein [Sphingomonas sp. ERG5]
MHEILLWAASLVAAVTWATHTFVGGVHVARPLLADTSLPPAAKWLSYYCWHLATLMIAAMALLFAAAALGHVGPGLTCALAVFALACSALSIAVALKGGIRPWRFPSTSLFLVTGLLGLASGCA